MTPRLPPVLRGDAPEINRSLYQRPLTLDDAQAMVDLLVEHFDVRPMGERHRISIQHGRTTVRRWGIARWRGGPQIVLHPKGMNEGTVLHEFAHWLAGFVAGHGPAYKRAQRRAYDAWQGVTR